MECSNRFAQFSSNQDQVEDGSSADHRGAWNSDGVTLGFAQSCSDTIIALKSRDGVSDDLRLGVGNTEGGFVLLDHQKDGRRAMN